MSGTDLETIVRETLRTHAETVQFDPGAAGVGAQGLARSRRRRRYAVLGAAATCLLVVGGAAAPTLFDRSSDSAVAGDPATPSGRVVTSLEQAAGSWTARTIRGKPARPDDLPTLALTRYGAFHVYDGCNWGGGSIRLSTSGVITEVGGSSTLRGCLDESSVAPRPCEQCLFWLQGAELVLATSHGQELVRYDKTAPEVSPVPVIHPAQITGEWMITGMGPSGPNVGHLKMVAESSLQLRWTGSVKGCPDRSGTIRLLGQGAVEVAERDNPALCSTTGAQASDVLLDASKFVLDYKGSALILLDAQGYWTADLRRPGS